jgi:phospholipid/cholesterol/gamma-HCH transport system substrate-binding protein
MSFRKKDESNLIKVGIFISSMTIILMIMIVSIGRENSFFQSKREITARVQNVKNLKPGSYVELKGITVGTVQKISIISEDLVEIKFTVLESELKWIKQDSKISISTAGLVGDKFLEIYDGSKSSSPFDPEKDVLTSENLTDLKQIMSKGDSIATTTERILSRLDLILLNMDEDKKINATMNAIHRASLHMEKVTEELHHAQLGKTMNHVNMSMKKLESASVSMEKIMSRIENGPGTMNSLIFDDGLHDDLRSLLGGASRNKVIKYFIRESIKGSERK